MEFRLSDAVEVLAATPGVLRAMLGSLGTPWVHNHYGAETFCPFDVVGHLIHGERTDWMMRVRMILEHGDSRDFEPFDRYAMYDADRGRTLAELLETFESLRRGNLADLASLRLTREQLQLRGRHPALGPVTMQQLLATWVVHDLNHIHQVAKCMAWQYRAEVGPWRAYIPFLPTEAS